MIPLEELIKATHIVNHTHTCLRKASPCAPTQGQVRNCQDYFAISEVSLFWSHLHIHQVSLFFHFRSFQHFCLYNFFHQLVKSENAPNAPSFEVKASMIVCLFSKAKQGRTLTFPYKSNDHTVVPRSSKKALHTSMKY
jgi:hypothetical protein